MYDFETCFKLILGPCKYFHIPFLSSESVKKSLTRQLKLPKGKTVRGIMGGGIIRDIEGYRENKRLA